MTSPRAPWAHRTPRGPAWAAQDALLETISAELSVSSPRAASARRTDSPPLLAEMTTAEAKTRGLGPARPGAVQEGNSSPSPARGWQSHPALAPRTGPAQARGADKLSDGNLMRTWKFPHHANLAMAPWAAQRFFKNLLNLKQHAISGYGFTC